MPANTAFLDLNAVLDALVGGQQHILGADLIGVYLQGSFAVGDFDAHSDVDLTFVVADELSDGQVAALQVLHGRVYDSPVRWAQHLEGSYFPRAVLRDRGRCGEPLWYLDNGSRRLVRSDHCNTIVVRWVLHEKGIALTGPPLPTLLDPVPADLLRADVLATILDWGREILANPGRFDNRFYQSFIVLSYCRMLHSLAVGRVASKRAGAAWAQQHLDRRWHGLIDRTWAARPDPATTVRQPADPHDFAATLAFVRRIVAACERAGLESPSVLHEWL